jgi:hypothetical protein
MRRITAMSWNREKASAAEPTQCANKRSRFLMYYPLPIMMWMTTVIVRAYWLTLASDSPLGMSGFGPSRQDIDGSYLITPVIDDMSQPGEPLSYTVMRLAVAIQLTRFIAARKAYLDASFGNSERPVRLSMS